MARTAHQAALSPQSKQSALEQIGGTNAPLVAGETRICTFPGHQQPIFVLLRNKQKTFFCRIIEMKIVYIFFICSKKQAVGFADRLLRFINSLCKTQSISPWRI